MATDAIPHGGRLAKAQADHPSAPRPWLDLSTGVNPHGWRKGRASTSALARLPDPEDTAELEAVAASAFGVDAACVVAIAGAEAGLRRLPEMIDARNVAIASPTYGSHADAWRLAGRAVRETARNRLFEDDADLFVVVNPNNPDGAISPGSELVKAAAGRWLIIDESFVELAPDMSAAHLVGSRTLVLRSFGKFFGLPGVRLGFILCDAALAARFRRRNGDWPVGVDALSMGRAAYADTAWSERTRSLLDKAAERLDRMLTDTGFDIVGGASLFRLARCEDAARRAEALARQGVLVRTFAHDQTLIRFGLPERKHWRRLRAALEITK